jgi:hypothetical protein
LESFTSGKERTITLILMLFYFIFVTWEGELRNRYIILIEHFGVKINTWKTWTSMGG